MKSIIRIKVNVSGSWANLVDCDARHYAAVKAACVTLAKAHQGGRIRFKALDAEDRVIGATVFQDGFPRKEVPRKEVAK